MGDVIVSLNDQAVEDLTDLRRFLRSKKPKDEITVVVTRDGQERTFKVKLSARPED